MKSIVAKMKCDSVEKTEFGETVKLSAVTADTEENKTFSDATPSASVTILITNKDAFGAFEPGKCHFVNFSPAN